MAGLLIKGRVKLSTEGLDEENQAVELKDYGQYPWGLCEGSLFKPKLPRDRLTASSRHVRKNAYGFGQFLRWQQLCGHFNFGGLVGGKDFH